MRLAIRLSKAEQIGLEKLIDHLTVVKGRWEPTSKSSAMRFALNLAIEHVARLQSLESPIQEK